MLYQSLNYITLSLKHSNLLYFWIYTQKCQRTRLLISSWEFVHLKKSSGGSNSIGTKPKYSSSFPKMLKKATLTIRKKKEYLHSINFSIWKPNSKKSLIKLQRMSLTQPLQDIMEPFLLTVRQVLVRHSRWPVAQRVLMTEVSSQER